jgi:hypothetical protein
MARQSYLSRIAGAAPAPGLQLTAVTDVADARPAALSSLLQHLSSPSALPQPPTAASFPAAVPAMTGDAPDRPSEVSRLADPPLTHPVRFDQAGKAPASSAPEPTRLSPPRRPMADARPAIDSVPAATAAAAALPEPRRAAQPAPPEKRPDAAVALQQPQAAAPAQVHVHIGTVEVRAKPPAIHTAPPAPAPIPATAAFSAPMRGYGWGFGLIQR